MSSLAPAPSIFEGKRKMIFYSILSTLAVILRAFNLIDETGVTVILGIAGGGFGAGNFGEHIGAGMGRGSSSTRDMVDRARQTGEAGFARMPALFVLLFGSVVLLALLGGCGGLSTETVGFEPDEAWVEGDYSFEGEARYLADEDPVTDYHSEGTLDAGGAGNIVVDTNRGELTLPLQTGILVEHENDELVLHFCAQVAGFFDDCHTFRFGPGDLEPEGSGEGVPE